MLHWNIYVLEILSQYCKISLKEWQINNNSEKTATNVFSRWANLMVKEKNHHLGYKGNNGSRVLIGQ